MSWANAAALAGRRGAWLAVASVGAVVLLLALAARASGTAPIPTGCSPDDVRQDIQSGGAYVFDCAGPVTILAENSSGAAEPFEVPSGETVSFDGTSSQVTFDGDAKNCPALASCRAFIVDGASGETPAASLTLIGVTVTDSFATSSPGADGQDGGDGADGGNGADGHDGNGPGSPGVAGTNAPDNAGEAGSGTDGSSATDAFGGAVSNDGSLTVENCVFTNNDAVAAKGGDGGGGGDGGNGGYGGNGGAGGNASSGHLGAGGNGGTSGDGGPGAAGGDGANGGSGGNANGGAIYNAATATLTVSGCTFEQNQANGGSGGLGGDGGFGGLGGSGAMGGAGGYGEGSGNNGGRGGNSGAGGTGGDGGDGGDGGAGGAGGGGAIFNNGGSVAITDSTFQQNSVYGENGGSGGSGGGGGAAGVPAMGGFGGNSGSGRGGNGGNAGAGGIGGNGGNGGEAGTGGQAFGGAIYSTNSIYIDSQTVSQSMLRLANSSSPTNFSENTISGGATPNSDNKGFGGPLGCNGPCAGAPGQGGTGATDDGSNGKAGSDSTPGSDGDAGPANNTPVLTGGVNVYVRNPGAPPPPPPPPLQLSGNNNLPGATQNTSYSATITATGGDGQYSWEIDGGTLPPGLSFEDGVISGTPTEPGPYQFEVVVTDAAGNKASGLYNLSVSANGPSPPLHGQLEITTGSLPDATQGMRYDATIDTTGGEEPVVLLPLGPAKFDNLTFSDGTIKGTPKKAEKLAIRVEASDSSTPRQQVQRTVTLTVKMRACKVHTGQRFTREQRNDMKTILKSQIAWLRQSLAVLKREQAIKSQFKKYFDPLIEHLPVPTLTKQALVAGWFLVERLLLDNIARDITLEKRLLNADQALLDALDRNQKNIDALYEKAIRAGIDEKKTEYAWAEGYRAFVAVVHVLTDWLLKNPELKKSPVYKDVVGQFEKWLDKNDKNLHEQVELQDKLDNSHDKIAEAPCS